MSEREWKSPPNIDNPAPGWVGVAEDYLDYLFGDDDPEEFCPACFAGMESSEHLTDPRCGAA